MRHLKWFLKQLGAHRVESRSLNSFWNESAISPLLDDRPVLHDDEELARLNDVDATLQPRRPSQSTITRQQGGVESLGEGHVYSVIGSEVVAERPYPVEKRLVSVSLQVEGSQVIEHLAG